MADEAPDPSEAPARPPLTSYADWPYKVRALPFATLLSYAGLATMPPRADVPELVEG
jgi:hypothetical protein